ncbi:MAG TPA: translation initiation factor IF-2 [Bdellovibrionota bacterium]|jgi:translation initiation factor IF-2|nr:translation initiation factor IF-2 [Bdellovibrionota bacterium]
MSDNLKVFELAKELDLKALDLIDKVKPLGLQIKNHMASLTSEEVEKIREFLGGAAPTAGESKPKKSASSDSSKKPVRRKATVITRTRKQSDEEEVREPLNPGETQVVQAAPQDEPEEMAVASESSPEEIIEAPVEIEAVSSSVEDVVEGSVSQASREAAGTVEESSSATSAPAPAVEPKRSRYSVIRVTTAETPTRAKPLIVEEASEDFADVFKSANKGKGIKGKKFDEEDDVAFNVDVTRRSTFADDDFDDDKPKKGAAAPKKSSAPTNTDSAMFRSTDYLRRERVYQYKKKRLAIGRSSKKTELTTAAAHKRVVDFDKLISVEDLAEQLTIKARMLKRKLLELGVDMPDEVEGFADWHLDLETAQVVAQEFGFEIRDNTFREDSHIAESIAEDANAAARSPVVTIMGHVDHGKTSLLDIIRKSSVTEGEAGGITQHIGAYTVIVDEAVANLKAMQEAAKSGDKKGKKDRTVRAKGENFEDVETTKRLTFLDTPGHAAFTAMRSRGAAVTDIVIIVVAASEGVMPQTREAVEHAKAAGVPIIVAMNKMDLPDANPQRIIQQLSDLGILAEEWGGEVPFVPVSAKTGMGVDKLLEMILLQAEVMELSAVDDGFAEGSIVEANLDKGRGPVATCLVQKGKLEKGQYIVAGKQIGRVRALIDDKGRQIDWAGPSTPVQILGLDGVPGAGDKLNALKDERAARELVEYRINEEREAAAKNKRMSLEELFAKFNEGEIKELPLIIKSDVRGSGEAIEGSLMKLPQDKVKIKILSNSPGGITASDVLLASASNAIILGFSVRPDNQAKRESEDRGVQIKTYDIIYNLIDDVRASMEGLLDPTIVENNLGQAEVRNVFTITKVGAVAGSYVTSGKIQRNAQARLVREGRVIYTGKISGLKRFKDDAKEVAEGYECGISLENYNDIKAGDVIEAYLIESKAQSLGANP